MHRIRELFDPTRYITVQSVLAEDQNNASSEHGITTKERVSFSCAREIVLGSQDSSNVKIVDSLEAISDSSGSKFNSTFAKSHEENLRDTCSEPEQYPFVRKQKHDVNEEIYVDVEPSHCVGKKQFKSSFQVTLEKCRHKSPVHVTTWDLHLARPSLTTSDLLLPSLITSCNFSCVCQATIFRYSGHIGFRENSGDVVTGRLREQTEIPMGNYAFVPHSCDY